MNGINLANITGLFLGSNEYTQLYYGSTLIWSKGGPTPPPHDYEKDYFTTVAQGSGNIVVTITSTASSTTAVYYISYSTDDGITWTQTSFTNAQTLTITVPVNNNDKVLWKGNKLRYYEASQKIRFNGTTNFSVEGNIMSLTKGDNFYQTSLSQNSQFRELFCDSTYLVDASNFVLPSNTTNSCYQSMFDNCSNLVTAPTILPATTLTNFCYQYMFRDCVKLITSPELPAPILATQCYRQMFDGCVKLNYVKCLATDISASYCLYSWLRSVSSTGTLYKKAGVTYPSGSDGKPSGWTTVNV